MKNLKEKLNTIQSLNEADKIKILYKLPVRLSTKLYFKHCTNSEITELLEAWHNISIKEDDARQIDKNVLAVQKKHKQKIVAMVNLLKKKNKLSLVPSCID
jgi:hypothetical protein